VSEPSILRIPVGEVGGFGLALVDRAAVGYDDDWQAPAGGVLPTIALDDYNAGSTTWQCQLTAAQITASPNVNTVDRPGTFCQAPGQTTTVGEDTFAMEIGGFQDHKEAQGLAAFMYENRTKEAFFYFSADGPDGAPRAIGRLRLTSMPMGGDAWTDLTFTGLSLPIMRAPDIEFGSGLTTRIVLGAGTAAVTAGADADVTSDAVEVS
jgi:hypothetical protein